MSPKNNKNDRAHSLNVVLNHTRLSLNERERRLSKLIHNPTVEMVDEIVSKVLFRPSGIIGAGLLTLVGLAILAFQVGNVRFQMSGSETLILLVSGYFIGLVIEWFKKSLSAVLNK